MSDSTTKTMYSVTFTPMRFYTHDGWCVDGSGSDEQAWTEDEDEARAVFESLRDMPRDHFEVERACGGGRGMGGRGYSLMLERVVVEVFGEGDEEEVERELLDSVDYTYDDWREEHRAGDDGEEE